MFYRSDVTPDDSAIDIEGDLFLGERLKLDIKSLAQRLVNDERSKDNGVSPLDEESFVIAIHGGWGTGKSWAAKALINFLKRQYGYRRSDLCHIFHFDLLPFSNVNDSVTDMLCRMSDRIWKEGIEDVRYEFDQIAIDATPAREMSTGVSFLGLSVSRKILKRQRGGPDHKVSLREKFSDLAGRGHRFIVTLDDLDRLKPDEVMVVARMVENFKDVPGVIFILPFHRKPVAMSIKEVLKLDDASAYVFMRKFIKASIAIDLTVQDLRDSFITEVKKGFRGPLSSDKAYISGHHVSVIAWYIFLHVVIVNETISSIDGSDAGLDAAVAKYYGKHNQSYYMSELEKRLTGSLHPGADTPVYPYRTGRGIEFFANVYRGLSSLTSGAIMTRSHLDDLLNIEMLTNKISHDDQVIDSLRQVKSYKDRSARFSSSSTSNEDTEDGAYYSSDMQVVDQFRKSKKGLTVFETILLPILRARSQQEPRLTANYSRRDILQLASAIARDPEFTMGETDAQSLYNMLKVTEDRYREFR